ncbi:ATP-dependent helicase BRM [Typha angustifolia]|uniref:ATP-dependent helicase BRM n=1 Tax=Typha angustifolia TaxID=59011 RepID=UPI003C2AD3B2
MQSGGGGGAAGNGRNPAAPPTPSGRPSPSSSASPSSSSSAQGHLGFDSIQQQQLAYRQALHQQEQQRQQRQQHELRKAEGENVFLSYQSGGAHGVMGGSNFPSSSGVIPLPQPPRTHNDLTHQSNQPGGPQFREENQNTVLQAAKQHVQNANHQAYLQLALQAAQHKSHGNMLAQQQGKMNVVGSSGRDQEMLTNMSKMQELMSLQAASQAQSSMFKRSSEHFAHAEKQMEQGQSSAEQRNDLKSPQIAFRQQLATTNMVRPPMQSSQSQANLSSVANNQLAMSQLQALQTWAKEHNLDLSVPANVNLIAQVLPLWQSARMSALQKQNETSITAQQSLPSGKQQVMPSPVGSENSAHGNSLSEISVQTGPLKSQQSLPPNSMPTGAETNVMNLNNMQMQQQISAYNRESQNERVVGPSMTTGNGRQVMHLPQTSGSINQAAEPSHSKNTSSVGSEAAQMQYLRPQQHFNRPAAPRIISNETVGPQIPSQGVSAHIPQERIGFTKQQLHVLKAQILAFRRLKRGERTLPSEVLEAITSQPSDPQAQQSLILPGMVNRERVAVNNAEEHVRHTESNQKAPEHASLLKGQRLPKEEASAGEEKASVVSSMHGMAATSKEPLLVGSISKLDHNNSSSVKSEQEVERGSPKTSVKGDYNGERGKSVAADSGTVDVEQVKKPSPTSNTPSQRDVTRKYHGPIFDFPSFTRKHDSLGSVTANYSSNLTLAYDVKDLLVEEGIIVLNKKRTENLQKISGLLAVNLERRRIRPDLVLRLQIEEKKLRLLDLQARLRDEVDQQQQEIMAMSDRPYRKFVRECERQRVELLRQVQQAQKVLREKQLKSIIQWRKKLLEAHWAIRDARTARNRGVAKYHERMLREFSKKKDDGRDKRMEALKNNDVDRYREMLLEQQTNIHGDAAQRYSVLSSFLSQTEEYLLKLGGKITAAKNFQEVEEASNAAATAARAQGLSEEEVKTAAACAAEEVVIRNRFSEMNAPRDNSSANKYYNLAHAVNERVIRQPSMLRCGTLRDYQLVGLQWMLSLYNNKLNGILADEMGLGKTVQVMALIAYLMEFKGNYGPHLIIVPNAVLVNWKSELLNWLPSVSCIFYVGGKDQRSKLFSQEVCAIKFNVLVTTYEFVMYDRSKLSKIGWKYIIIDEAQRMKDRESVLARDLDRYRCQRRLLLTGTPLQNDLKELWSLLNLLLPEVFDNRKAFHDWFSKPFQKDGPSHNPEEDDWLETEKKVIIIHRLHQILEPFMLRRRVEDVEGSLPRKVSIVLRCRMSAIQGAIYDWIKSTGTIRVDPDDELRRVQKNPMYQVKMFKNLNNKCMELRKACNHPLLNYPYFNDYSKDFVVKSCGKLWILDRILIKLQRAGHRVLLFSTMTKLLDILEEYLQWRRLVYRRIDGTTTLEDRESAIVDFNSPDSDCFIFLLSIRAAGRGLNLQSADTVVIYDPDPNPQNEEQAVARAHRIGQKREVKVIYMEAVVDKISSYQKEDELRNGGSGDLEEDLAGRDRYMGSIESLIRNNIQQYKIDMADEVINAGRFDQRTTHEERRMTLETLLHDEERYQETVHDVPSLQQVNRMIARSEEEIELFDQMDEDFDWTGDMVKHHQVPKWLRASSREVDSIVNRLSKKPSKNILSSNHELESGDLFSGPSTSKTERRRGRPKGSSTSKSYLNYREVDDDDFDDSDADIEERNASSLLEEEGEIGEFEDEEYNDTVALLPNNKDQLEEEVLISNGGGYEFSQAMEGIRTIHRFEDAGSSGSSSGSRRIPQPVTPSMSSQKFGSLSALDARPDPLSKRTPDELEEGEIALSGDSHMDLQQSVSWNHDRDDGEDEQVLQPKIKRKRSIRFRSRYTAERLHEKSSGDRAFNQRGSQLPLPTDNEFDMPLRSDQEVEAFKEPLSGRQYTSNSSRKPVPNLPSRKTSPVVMQKSGRLSYFAGPPEDSADCSKGSWSNKVIGSAGPSLIGKKMSDSMQRKCKNVISKLRRRIDKDGHQLVPMLSEWWRRNENSSLVASTSSPLDLQKIEQRVDGLEYNGVTNFIADVQLMLKNVVRYCNYSSEVRQEAGKLQDVFFDIMKIAFPDSDFREARNAVSFSSPLGSASAAPSPKQAPGSQSKHRTPISEAEQETGPPKNLSRGSTSIDEGKNRGFPSKLQREPRPASGSGREQVSDCTPLLAHPGDLVICKKKRKDREKSAVKQRAGPGSPSSSGRVGPLSPSNPGRMGPVSSPHSMSRSVRAPFQRDPHTTQPATNPVGWAHKLVQQPEGGGGASPGIGDVQWAKPVKRMRTDAGKRRPSHM